MNQASNLFDSGRAPWIWGIWFACSWSVLGVTDPLPAQEREALPPFADTVLPLLQTHCIRCHGPEDQEASVRLDTLSTDLIDDPAATDSWHNVLSVLNDGRMPPEDEPQLSPRERETMVDWIATNVEAAIAAQQQTRGRVVLRRLNRVEYQHTMFDLLGLDMNYARDLPPDSASSDGFRNNGQSLRMSPLQLEYYLDTARRALERVIVSGPAPQVFKHEFTASNVGNWLGGVERSTRLQRKQVFLASMPKEYPEEGEFRIRVKLTAELKPDAGFPILEVLVGYRPDTQILFNSAGVIEIVSAEEQVHEFRGRLENFPLPVRGQGKYPGLVVMVRNLYDDGSPLPKRKDHDLPERNKREEYLDEPSLPTLVIQSVDFEAPYFAQWPPALHRRVLFDSKLRETDEVAYVRAVLKRFMTRAYRRPVKRREVAQLTKFFQSIRLEFPTFEATIRETLAMVLIRPEFLYLMEPAGQEKRQITDWELASRLSYFLWSTMPDSRLRNLARRGKLHAPGVLTREVNRMLDDARSLRFIEQFTEQWLHLDQIDQVAVNRDYYPNFDDKLKNDMRQETQHFFAELLRCDLNANHLLSSDFTMLNERLARHYGIDGVWGEAFRRVALDPEQHRGGLLGQASILLSNSTGADSHAVRRAVWIRDRLLNDPPAPPPPNVPALDEAKPEFLRLSIREQLEIHRGTESCANCHKDIDPWGIALENFDAVGLWRDQIRRQVDGKFEMHPVDAVDQLPQGREINGVEGLRELLLSERQDQFARSLASYMLSYALGRELELSDAQALDEIVQKFHAADLQLRDLVLAVATSPLFLSK